jgi:hypothetical protein
MTPEQMREAIIRNLPARTGKSLEKWLGLVRRQACDLSRNICVGAQYLVPHCAQTGPLSILG